MLDSSSPRFPSRKPARLILSIEIDFKFLNRTPQKHATNINNFLAATISFAFNIKAR